MTSSSFGIPYRTLPVQYSALARPTFDDASFALNESEANEFAVRLIGARSEPEFNHLLGAILTHAVARSGGWLSPPLGSALGGLLKSIARQGLSKRMTARALGLELEGLEGVEREFETALQFVRLAAEAARHAAQEPMIAPSRTAAHAALAAAADIFAPPLTTYTATNKGRFGSGANRPRPTIPSGVTHSSFGARSSSVWMEPFDYDPEMEYFLGGLVRSVGGAIKGVTRAVGKIGPVRDIARAASTIARTASKIADTVGKVPILGDVARAGIGAARLAVGPAAIAIDAGSRLARGENLGDALKGAVIGQIDAVRDQLKLAEMVAPFIPGIGSGVAAALGAANALAAGRPITEAVLAAARSALPGGKIAQAAFDVAISLAKGKNIGESALAALQDQLPGGPAARAALDTAMNLAKGKNFGEAALAAVRDRLPGGPAGRAAFDAAVALGQGKRLQDAAFAAAGRIVPPSPYAADALSFVKRVANGQNIQNAALSAAAQRVLRQVRGNAAIAASLPKGGWRGSPPAAVRAAAAASAARRRRLLVAHPILQSS